MTGADLMELREAALGWRSVAYLIRGMVPNHIWSRAEALADKALKIIEEQVPEDDDPTCEKELAHVNLDADWPEVRK